MNKIIITSISLLFMYSHLNADVIKFKKPNSSDEFILSNIKILSSDTEFVYYKNNVSFNTNKISCPQIIEITNNSGDIIQSSCIAKSLNLNSIEKTPPTYNNINNSNLNKSKSNSFIHKKKPNQFSEKKNQLNDVEKKKDSSQNINLLLMGLIIFFIFFKLNE